MERFDLYTAEREKTGKTMVRGEATPEGFYRLVVHVCLFDEEGRMLIQQRQPFKKGWANLWDVSVGGHSISGETSRMTAERETFEELGLSFDFSNVRPTLTIHWENGFDDYYVLTQPVDTDSLKLQYEEVQTVKWADKDEILKMIDGGQFIPYEKSLIELLFFRRDHRSVHTESDPTKRIKHPIPPLFDENSKVLILGSFPSVKSREAQFFYGHPQNRFWKVVSTIFNEPVPQNVDQKRELLLRNHIAVWDVIESCEIEGSADSTIRNVKPNDLSVILDVADIKEIFVNGRTAEKYFNKYTKDIIGRSAICLPSTSPANAAWSIERLVDSWKVIRRDISCQGDL